MTESALMVLSSHWKQCLCFAGVRCAYLLQHWLEDEDLDRIMKNYDENADGRPASPLSSYHRDASCNSSTTVVAYIHGRALLLASWLLVLPCMSP